MGWLLGSGLVLPVSCLVLVWAVGSGSFRAPHQPTCFSDYISTSTCEWTMAGPTNCSAELRLTYQLHFLDSENHTCVPENRGGSACLCNMLMESMVSVDTYQLDLWAGERLLWSGSFKPSEHVKPWAPGNLTVEDAAVSRVWQLTWSNPYPHDSFLYSELSYQVAISSEDDPTEVEVHNVTYKEPTLRLPASTLKPGVSYRAWVRARAQSYSSTWSEWSPSVTWHNYHQGPWERHLPFAVILSSTAILFISMFCYFSVTKIKKEWWDQIPNPARSPLVAIVIQESQVSLWRRGPEASNQPSARMRWKTCLTKLLPCLLEHTLGRDGSSSQAAGSQPLQGPGLLLRCPVEVCTRVLSPESVSVVKRVELLETQVQGEEEEEVEEDGGSFCQLSESSGCSFVDPREGIAARLTESLFLDLLGTEHPGFCPQGMGESGLLPPSDSGNAQSSWAELPREEPLNSEPAPPSTLTKSPARLAFTEMLTVVSDNPSYRPFRGQASSAAELASDASDAQLSECPGAGDPNFLSATQSSEPPTALQPELETWEQVLRRSVLQHQAAPMPTADPTCGYRGFECAVKQGSTPSRRSSGCGLSGDRDAGYKAFSSLLASGATSPGSPRAEAGSGEECYRPSQSLASGCPGGPTSVPLFTFGLDVEPRHSPQNSLLPSSCPECPGTEPVTVTKGGDSQKLPLCLEQATDPLGEDLGSGIVYSALTCHLCGHLKHCHNQEERGEAHSVSSPCCGYSCGDGSQALVSPLRDPDPLPGGFPLEAGLHPASLAPVGVLEEGKSFLFFQASPSSAQSPSQTPGVVAVLSAGSECTSAP